MKSLSKNSPIIFFVFAASVFPSNLIAQDKPESDLESKGLKGKIKTYTEYKVKGNDKTKIVSHQYKENGNLSESVSFNPDGSTYNRTVYKQDPDGRQIESITYQADGTVRSKKLTKYNKAGLPEEVSFLSGSGGVVERFATSYNENNIVIEQLHIDGQGKTLSTQSFRFDKKGNKIEDLTSESSGKSTKISYKFDDKNQITEESREYGKEREPSKTIFKYNEAGIVVETIDHYVDAGKKVMMKTLLTYDKDGRKIEEKKFEGKGEELDSRKDFKYNAEGQLLEVITYSPTSAVIGRTIHVYDATGNKTEYSQFNSKGVKSTGYLYEISYY